MNKVFTFRGNRLLLLGMSATFMAEVVSGSTTLSRIQSLPLQFALYGSAVILVREVARRLALGWPTIIGLGLAFGFSLEGLVLQSVFNPHFLGNNLTFGRSLGINWVWVAYMPPFHAFWAISTPILLCELVYDEPIQKPWANRFTLGATLVLFLGSCLGFHFLFRKLTHFTIDGPHLVAVLLLVLLLVGVALKWPQPGEAPRSVIQRQPAYRFWLTSLIAFGASALWFLGLDTIFMAHKPAPWLALLGAPLLAVSFFTLLSKWPLLRLQTSTDKLALVSGLLMGEWLFGYLATAANPTDQYAQLFLLLFILPMLGLLYKRVGRAGFDHQR